MNNDLVNWDSVNALVNSVLGLKAFTVTLNAFIIYQVLAYYQIHMCRCSQLFFFSKRTSGEM